MKRIHIVIGLVGGLFAHQIIHAQGTIYLSNLNDPPNGSAAAVGSDSWLAPFFETGSNVGGYLFDSIQLAMVDASGNPIGFTVMLYTAHNGVAAYPGISIDTLNGSSNPSTTGIYTYVPTTDTTLKPNNLYFIVVTAGTAVANGAYEWSESAFYPTQNSDLKGGGVFYSSDGLNWPSDLGAYTQFAITVTAIPEPSTSFLLLLGSGVLFYVRNWPST